MKADSLVVYPEQSITINLTKNNTYVINDYSKTFTFENLKVSLFSAKQLFLAINIAVWEALKLFRNSNKPTCYNARASDKRK